MTRIITKGKKTFIFIFSKEILVAVFIFLKSRDIEPNVNWSSFPSPQVYQSCVTKSDTSRFLTPPFQIEDYILTSRGGSEFTDEQHDKLVTSIVAKTNQSSEKQISINKFLKKILKLIEPVISDQRFYKLISESRKPIKSELSVSGKVRSTDILNPSQNAPDKSAKTWSRGSSSFFAEALTIPNTRKLSPMQKRVQLKMSENNFSNNLESSGLSRNHQELSENIQFIEKLTRLRRAQPLYPSQVLGDSYQYGGKQLERKAPRHLEDFGISTEGKTVEEMSMEYKDFVEMLLSKPNLVIREDGTLNKQEHTINIGDPELRGIVSFENNPLYEDYHFISSYPTSPEAFEDFVETGAIGLSPEEKKAKMDAFQKKQAQAKRKITTLHSFYLSLPKEARIGNQQFRETEALRQKLKQDPNFQLTEKEKVLLQRAEKYKEYKDKFYQNNPDSAQDEL